MRHIRLFSHESVNTGPTVLENSRLCFPILVRLSSVCNNVTVNVHYIPSNTCLCVCLLSVYLSSVCMLVCVCTVSCQSVTLVFHTTCLSFVNVYVGTGPPNLSYSCALFPTITCPSVGLWHPALHSLSVFFLYLYASTPAYPSHSYAQCRPYMFVSVFLRPYVHISCSQLCVRVSVCHIHVYYMSLSYISTTVCRSTCLCVCLFSCTVVCPSVCYIRAPSSQYMSMCLAVHSSKFHQCL